MGLNVKIREKKEYRKVILCQSGNNFHFFFFFYNIFIILAEVH